MKNTQRWYQNLYRLQDLVMEEVFRQEAGFYLSGGTALTRFYFQHRYSDDLDFFTGDPNTFGDAVRLIVPHIESRHLRVQIAVDARDFKRLVIQDQTMNLKVDLVAERVPRVGLPVYVGTAYVDTVRNILSNKVSAVLSRDEPRDIADVLQICRNRAFSWVTVLDDAQRKQKFEAEDLAYRIASFPPTALNTVLFQSAPPSAYEVEEALGKISDDIASRGENSLSRANAPALS